MTIFRRFLGLCLCATLIVAGLPAASMATDQIAQAPFGKKGMRTGKTGARESMQGGDGEVTNPMHPAASRELQERTGLVKTGLRPIYPVDVSCPEVKFFFGDNTRYDSSSRPAFANHGYHGGFDISAAIGTPLVAIADGEVVHKYVGG